MQLPVVGYVRQTQLIGDRKKGIAGVVPFSHSTLWRKVTTGEFPAPVKLSAGVTAWKVEDVRAWMEGRASRPHARLEERAPGLVDSPLPQHVPTTKVKMLRYVTITKFVAESGYSENAIRSKIRDGIWREGLEWRKAPDGRVLIDIDGYYQWVESGSVLNVRRKPTQASSPPPLAQRRKPGQSGSPLPLK